MLCFTTSVLALAACIIHVLVRFSVSRHLTADLTQLERRNWQLMHRFPAFRQTPDRSLTFRMSRTL